jgi:hypothetical protein
VKKRKNPKTQNDSQVVRLEDLAPREDVAGGAGKLRFGERREPGERPSRPAGRKPGRTRT